MSKDFQTPDGGAKYKSPIEPSLRELITDFGFQLVCLPEKATTEKLENSLEAAIIEYMVKLAPEKFKGMDAPKENGTKLWSNGWNDGITKYIENIRGSK